MRSTFDDDWTRHCQASRVTHTLLAWAAAEPALAGGDLDDVMLRARTGFGDLAASDATMAALLRLAPGDQLARRTVLQAVLPRLIAVAHRHAGRSRLTVGDLTADLAGVAWEEAGGAHGRWAQHVAARLAGAVERHYLQTRGHQAHEDTTGDITGAGTGFPFGPAAAGPEVQWVDVARLLADAVERGVIGAEAARVLAHAALGGLTDAEIAARRGRTAAATKKARQRAVAALRSDPAALALLAR